ncbi:MAG: anion transporter [Kiritimatiellaeota bacterium]|nr:anion transporter [Kiritimatiellota bacterium]
MQTITLIIFALTYLGVALGGLPGLALDRTGFALLGAIAMVASGWMTTGAAFHALDMPTLVLLYALMVVSAQLRLGGFYAQAALGLSQFLARPVRFLGLLMGASAALSAVLTNDIICLTFTPVVAAALLRARLNPVPFLLGLAVATNIGSAATIIGNPQNMLIGQTAHLDFGAFLLWCLPPSLLALALAWVFLAWLYRGRFHLTAEVPPTAVTIEEPQYDAHQSRKGLLAVAVLMALFFTHLPRELVAITIAGWLLCSRRVATSRLLGLIDWHLLTLFCGLFVVIHGLELTGLPAQLPAWLAAHGWDLHHLPGLALVTAALSNFVSNVPAVMLLTRLLPGATPETNYVLALASTFAGNLFVIGSIANLIVIEQARKLGVVITFREHARTGIPVTLLSFLVLLLWIWLRT